MNRMLPLGPGDGDQEDGTVDQENDSGMGTAR